MKEILLTSSVLILVLSAARLLLRGKVSRRWQYAMWLLVALRLLIPVQFGQLRFSMVSLSQQLEQNVPQVHQQVQQMEQVLQQPVAGNTQQEIYDTLLQQAAQDGRDTQSVQVQQELQTQAREQTAPALGQVLQGVWLGGMVVMALWMCYVNFSFLLRVKRGAVRVPTEQTAVPVYIAQKVHGPCLAGLLRPAIYLPSGCVRDAVVDRYVLMHELTHLAHGDSFWALVRGICLCIYWFNPLVWLAAVLSKRDCELACDEAALEKLGEQERFAYGRTLVDMVARASSLQHLLETATSMSESKKQLTERVDFIVKKRKTNLIAAICLVLVAALAAGCSFAGPGGETNAPEPQPSTQPTEPTQQTQPSSEPTSEDPSTPAVEYPPEASGPVTIELWHTFAPLGSGVQIDNPLEAAAKEFNKNNQWGITVNTVYCGSYTDVQSKLQESIPEKSNPVLAVTSESTLATLAYQDIVQDLTLYLQRDGIDYNATFYESLTRNLLVHDVSGEGEAEILGVPFFRSVSLAYHNLKVWAEIGVTQDQIPTTIEDLVPLWEKLYNKTGKYGLAMPADPSMYQCGLIQSLAVKNTGVTNGGIIGVDGTSCPALTDGTFQTVVEDWESWCLAGWCWWPGSSGKAQELLLQCEVATVFAHSGTVTGYFYGFDQDVMDTGLTGDDLYLTLQPGYGGYGARSSGGNLTVLAQNHTPEEIDAAWKFLQYVAVDPEVSAHLAVAMGGVCANRAAVNTKTWQNAVAKLPLRAVAQDGMDQVYNATLGINRSQWNARVQEMLQAMEAQQQELDQMISQLEQEAASYFTAATPSA